MSTIHLLECGRSALSYHMVMAQNTIAVISDDIIDLALDSGEPESVGEAVDQGAQPGTSHR